MIFQIISQGTLSFEGHHYFLARACSIAGNSQGKGLGKFY